MNNRQYFNWYDPAGMILYNIGRLLCTVERRNPSGAKPLLPTAWSTAFSEIFVRSPLLEGERDHGTSIRW